MPLTEKDRAFLHTLSTLLQDGTLHVEVRLHPSPRFVLRRNYGAAIERKFGMTRQGIKWRFDRLLNDVYAESFVILLRIESVIGPGMRFQAMEIARQRNLQNRQNMAGETVYRRETAQEDPDSNASQM